MSQLIWNKYKEYCRRKTLFYILNEGNFCRSVNNPVPTAAGFPRTSRADGFDKSSCFPRRNKQKLEIFQFSMTKINKKYKYLTEQHLLKK